MGRQTELASHERSQLLDFLPEILDLYERRLNLSTKQNEDQRQERYENLLRSKTAVENEDDIEPWMWRSIVIALDEAYENEYQWLRAKLARRTEQPPEMQGFTTRVPVGAMMTTHREVSPVNKLDRLPNVEED